MKRHEKIHPDPLKDSWNGAKKAWGGLHISGWTTMIATFQTMELFLCFLTFDTCIIHPIDFFKMNLLQATGKSAYKRKRCPWQQCLWYQRGALGFSGKQIKHSKISIRQWCIPAPCFPTNISSFWIPDLGLGYIHTIQQLMILPCLVSMLTNLRRTDLLFFFQFIDGANRQSQFFSSRRRLGSSKTCRKRTAKGKKWFGRSNDVVWTCGTSLFFCSLFPPPWKLAKIPLGCESNLQVTQHQDSINRFIVIKLVTQTGEPCKHHLGFVSRPS